MRKRERENKSKSVCERERETTRKIARFKKKIKKKGEKCLYAESGWLNTWRGGGQREVRQRQREGGRRKKKEKM